MAVNKEVEQYDTQVIVSESSAVSKVIRYKTTAAFLTAAIIGGLTYYYLPDDQQPYDLPNQNHTLIHGPGRQTIANGPPDILYHRSTLKEVEAQTDFPSDLDQAVRLNDESQNTISQPKSDSGTEVLGGRMVRGKVSSRGSLRPSNEGVLMFQGLDIQQEPLSLDAPGIKIPEEKMEIANKMLRYLDGNPNFSSETEKVQFVQKVIEIADWLDPQKTNPNLARHFMVLIGHESNFSSHAVNPISGALGLNQFLPSWLIEAGIDPKEFKEKMSKMDQLELMRQYYGTYRGKLKGLKEVILRNVAPSKINAGLDEVLFSAKEPGYISNSSVDTQKKGYITPRDVMSIFLDTARKRYGDNEIY